MNDHQTITGIYPGTFDPVTFGHLDIVERACNIVDKLIISAAENIHKKPFFTIGERVSMIKESLKLINTNKCLIEVVGFDNLLVDHAKRFNAKVIIRGLRAVSDFEYEFQLAGMNRKLNSNIETLFLMSDVENQIISSRFVKEIVKLNGNIGKFTTKSTIKSLKEKL